MRILLLTLLAIVPFLGGTTVHAAGAVASVMESDGSTVTLFTPFADAEHVGGVAAADLGGDGIAEILVGAGKGMEPLVSAHRQDGSKIGEFLAYDARTTTGVTVAACDLTGDGISEIVTGVLFGGGPHIRVFTNYGRPLTPGFFAYDKSFRGGVNVACGDVDGDGAGDIITGAGLTGGPHVRVFTMDGTLKNEIFFGSASDNGGAYISLGDTDGDGDDEILGASMKYGTPSVNTIDFADGELNIRANVSAATPSYGAPIFSTDFANDGTDDIGIASGGFTTASAQVMNEAGEHLQTFTPFSVTNQSKIIAARIKTDGGDRVIYAIASQVLNDDISEKSILVDVSEQTLTAFEYGVPVNTFLISTGRTIYPTPLGKTQVYDKLLYHDYVWSFGENHPENYNVKNVKYNLRIYRHIYIHYVWWHNNFGNRMSHGCVNANYENSEWIYNWANVGTPVNIVQ